MASSRKLTSSREPTGSAVRLRAGSLRDSEGDYVALVAMSSIGNDGTLLAKCLMNE
jgi:hypothetical protein